MKFTLSWLKEYLETEVELERITDTLNQIGLEVEEVIDKKNELKDFNCVIIENSKGFQSIGTSQGFPIPEKYIEEIKQTELGKVMDKIFSGKDLGKGKGGISYLTKNEVSRIDLTRNAFVMALTKHINGDVWR